MVNEKKIISKQLGREPGNLIGVTRYCPYRKPAVIKTHPYSDKLVIPTLFWLSCPHLVREVSRIEETGLIKELTTRMKVDQSFREEVDKAHHVYAKERVSLLTDEEIREIKKKSPGILKVLKDAGVGGIMEKEGIKCLHTHLADFLVTGRNPVGEQVWKLVDWPEQCKECEPKDGDK